MNPFSKPSSGPRAPRGVPKPARRPSDAAATASRGNQSDSTDADPFLLSEYQRRTNEAKTEGLRSSRRTLQRLFETESIAQSSVQKVGEQGQILKRAEERIEDVRGEVQSAEVKTAELKRLNRSIFLPNWSFGKVFGKEKRAPPANVEDADVVSRAAEEERGGASSTSGQMAMTQFARASENALNEHVDTLVQDKQAEPDKEIDSNLNAMSGSISRLKAMTVAMGDELETHNKRIDRMGERTVATNARMGLATRNLEKVAGLKPSRPVINDFPDEIPGASTALKLL